MLFYLSFRNLGRNTARTILLIGAIALVTALVAIMQAQLKGLQQDVYTLIIRNTVGDAQILQEKAGKPTHFIFNKKQLCATFPALTCLPTLHTQAWLQQNKTIIPLQLLGTDKWGGENIQGLTLSPTLLAVLKIKVGDSIALKPTPNAPKQFFKVAQARQLPLPQADNIALLPLATAQQFSQLAHKITNISLQFDEMPANLPAWVRRQGLILRTWQEASPEVLQMFTLLQATFALVSFILYGLLGLGVLLVFTQNWRERKAEIARLRILGMTIRQVWGMLVAELGVVLGLGYMVGLLLALPTIAYFAINPVHLHTDIAKALQSVGFPARLSVGWSWEIILIPLFGWVIVGLGLAGVAFGFAKTAK